MADRMPDYMVEQQRIIGQLADQRMRVERFKLEIMEIESKRKTALVNWVATDKSIAELEEKLKALKKEHGVVDVDWDALKAQEQEEEDG